MIQLLIGSCHSSRAAQALLVTGLVALAVLLLLLRFAQVTDYLYHGLVKDPERQPPEGRVIVAPADGTVIYVRKVENGVIPEVVKQGIAVPLFEHTKTEAAAPFPNGILVGIFMSWNGVHINRAPIAGRISGRIIFNGPHMDMSEAERAIILSQLVPGWVSLKKLVGLPPYDIEDRADFVLKSARETLILDDVRGGKVYVVRIADYVVGKILTWVEEGDQVTIGQRLGMIAAGSQTDIFFEGTQGIDVRVREGMYVYGGETILATY